MNSIDIDMRPPREGDLPWMYSTWISSVLNSRALSGGKCSSCGAPHPHPDRGWAAAAAHSIATRLMGSSDIIVASHPTDSDQIFGYIVGDASSRLLHWVYTKYAFRRMHIGTRMMRRMFGELDGIDYTHGTPALSHLVERWGLGRHRSDLLNKIGRSDVR